MTLFEFLFQPPQKEYLAAFPNRPLWLNWLMWNIRNPMPGLGMVLKTDSIPGQSDWNPSFGWLFLKHKSGLPFVSFRAKAVATAFGKVVPISQYQSMKGNKQATITRSFPYIEFYLGWRPDGKFGAALRASCSKGY